jgi:hypothetical protein
MSNDLNFIIEHGTRMYKLGYALDMKALLYYMRYMDDILLFMTQEAITREAIRHNSNKAQVQQNLICFHSKTVNIFRFQN